MPYDANAHSWAEHRWIAPRDQRRHPVASSVILGCGRGGVRALHVAAFAGAAKRLGASHKALMQRFCGTEQSLRKHYEMYSRAVLLEAHARRSRAKVIDAQCSWHPAASSVFITDGARRQPPLHRDQATKLTMGVPHTTLTDAQCQCIALCKERQHPAASIMMVAVVMYTRNATLS